MIILIREQVKPGKPSYPHKGAGETRQADLVAMIILIRGVVLYRIGEEVVI